MEQGIERPFAVVALFIKFSLFTTSCIIHCVCTWTSLLFNEGNYNMRECITEEHNPTYHTGVSCGWGAWFIK